MRQMSATRIRLYPTPDQEAAFLRISGSCRLVYNLALTQRRDFHRQHRKMTGKSISWFGQKRELTELKRAEGCEFLSEVPVHCLQAALKNLDTAFANFFSGRSGYPKPRKRGVHDAFMFPDPAQITLRPGDGALVLPKFGKRRGDNGPIRAVFHRPVLGRVRSVTIVRDGAAWFASVLTSRRVRGAERDAATPPAAYSEDEVEGVDRGVSCPFVTSSGRFYGREAEDERRSRKRTRLQRELSRTERGSRRQEKALKRLRAHDAKTRRIRTDIIHQVTSEIAKNHRVIVIENLNVAGMTATARGTAETPGRNVAQKAGLNGAILDRRWGQFRVVAAYKAARRGGTLFTVPAPDTSRTCPSCHTTDAASRRSRDLFRCVACGEEGHADVVAAKEIRRRGLAALAAA